MEDLHVVPEGDLREHEVNRGCFCNPTQDKECPNLLIHHSLDRREIYEESPELAVN